MEISDRLGKLATFYHRQEYKCSRARAYFAASVMQGAASEFTPSPAWTEARMSSSSDGQSVLGAELAACPAVGDERIRTAIDLAIASRHDTLPRSIFMSHLTILDAAIQYSGRVELAGPLESVYKKIGGTSFGQVFRKR